MIKIIFKKNVEQPLVEFISTVPGLSSIEECLPKQSNKFLPSWWTGLPYRKAQTTLNDETFPNVKACPSFPDYFSQGFILPMWTDTILKYDAKTKIFQWKTSSDHFTWEHHNEDQFLSDVSYTYLSNPVHFIFKAVCPWRLKTPKGYSVYQLPLLYHFNDNISVMPGVIDTDIYHELNQQVMILKESTEIYIKRGTPLAQYIPFKREKALLEIRDSTLEDSKLFKNQKMLFQTKFNASNQYSLIRKSFQDRGEY